MEIYRKESGVWFQSDGGVSLIVPDVFLSGWQGSDGTGNHYDEICGVAKEPIQLYKMLGYEIVILGDEANMMSLREQSEFYDLYRWQFAPEDYIVSDFDEDEDSFLATPDFEQINIKGHTNWVVIDAGENGDESRHSGVFFTLQKPLLRISTGLYSPNSDTSFLIHRIAK